MSRNIFTALDGSASTTTVRGGGIYERALGEDGRGVAGRRWGMHRQHVSGESGIRMHGTEIKKKPYLVGQGNYAR